MRCSFCPEEESQTARYARRLHILRTDGRTMPYGATDLWAACEEHVEALERLIRLDRGDPIYLHATVRSSVSVLSAG